MTVEGVRVLIARFPTPANAHIVRGKLEGEGIPAVVIDEFAWRVRPGLLVPREKAAEAAKILHTLPGLFVWWSETAQEKEDYELG